VSICVGNLQLLSRNCNFLFFDFLKLTTEHVDACNLLQDILVPVARSIQLEVGLQPRRILNCESWIIKKCGPKLTYSWHAYPSVVSSSLGSADKRTIYL